MQELQADQKEAAYLYGEILKNARKREDRNLIDMVRRRLAENAKTARLTKSGCEVMPFPAPFTVVQKPKKAADFWKDQGFWRDLLPFITIFSVSLAWILYFFVLVANS